MATSTHKPKTGKPVDDDTNKTKGGARGLTALEISRLVQGGKLFGLPKDRSAIHKLAVADGWHFDMGTTRGGPAKFFTVPDKYLEPVMDITQIGDAAMIGSPKTSPPGHEEYSARRAAKKTVVFNDDMRIIGLQTVILIETRIPSLRRRVGDDVYTKIYLAIHKLLEQDVDQDSIARTVRELLSADLI